MWGVLNIRYITKRNPVKLYTACLNVITIIVCHYIEGMAPPGPSPFKLVQLCQEYETALRSFPPSSNPQRTAEAAPPPATMDDTLQAQLTHIAAELQALRTHVAGLQQSSTLYFSQSTIGSRCSQRCEEYGNQTALECLLHHTICLPCNIPRMPCEIGYCCCNAPCAIKCLQCPAKFTSKCLSILEYDE